MATSERAEVLLSRDLVDAVDRAVGRKHRAQFLAEAVQDKLTRLERSVAARTVAGSLAGKHIPEWTTNESTDAWVRSLRGCTHEGAGQARDS